ncbi:hypothetical protein BH09SUM1_BH09SUM1_09150 [soil metagenome]
MKIAFYITGHGLGHATRAILLMEALVRRLPSVSFLICTLAPREVLERYSTFPFDYAQVGIDAGAVEKDILNTDPVATLLANQKLYANRDEIIGAESARLCNAKVDLVLFDCPPLAAAIAKEACVPSIGIGNFTWDFIYADLAKELPEFKAIARQCRDDYALTTLFLRLPLTHDMPQFRRRRDMPLIARKGTMDVKSVREQLGLSASDVNVLVALRGLPINVRVHAGVGVKLLAFGDVTGPAVEQLGAPWQRRFTDVLTACDLVLSKPGYGIMSECLANGKPLLHLPRLGFAETPLLFDGLGKLLRHQEITISELEGGNLPRIAKGLMDAWPVPPVDANGAEVAADIIATEF